MAAETIGIPLAHTLARRSTPSVHHVGLKTQCSLVNFPVNSNHFGGLKPMMKPPIIVSPCSNNRRVSKRQEIVCEFGRRLEGKVALITGASQGIGEYIAKMFIKHGAIVANADISPPSSLADDADQILYIRCDVTKESDLENAVKTVVDKYGKLDIMINNAGVGDPQKKCILDNDLADFERVIKVNVTGVFLGIKQAASVMKPARGGTIINLGSISSIIGGQTSHAYSSSKHAVVGLTKNAAAELGQYGIRVNCLSSSALTTPLTMKFFKMLDIKGQNQIYSNLAGKTLDLDDLAYGALYLASEESKYVSGHNLTIDGGYTVTNPAFGLFSRSN